LKGGGLFVGELCFLLVLYLLLLFCPKPKIPRVKPAEGIVVVLLDFDTGNWLNGVYSEINELSNFGRMSLDPNEPSVGSDLKMLVTLLMFEGTP